MRIPRLLPGILSLGAAWHAALAADAPPCPVPDYKYLRYEEDYRYLARLECRTEAIDSIKFVPFPRGGDWFVSFGGELRWTIEYFDEPRWGQEPDEPPYLLQRYMAHADLHLGARTRFFLQLKSGLEDGRESGPRPFDEDELDLNQAFVDLELGRGSDPATTLRIGRQELGYGATRWVATREGVTVHQPFDGIKAIFRARRWRVDAFLTRPVTTETGVFDDESDTTRDFWGVYAARTGLDLYYLGLDRDGARFDQGTGHEVRHAVGARVWGKRGKWDFDVEPMLQFGSFGDGDILAFALESDTGRALGSSPLSPRVGLRANVASGDREPSDADLETFNPFFPRGIYHQIVNLSGHVNFLELQPTLTIPLTRTLTISPDVDFLWRESLDDGVYGVAGNLIRPAAGSRARTIATQGSLVTIWRPTRHISFVQIVTYSSPGRFLEETGSAEPTLFVSGWFAYKL
jgi:hypothetical protein